MTLPEEYRPCLNCGALCDGGVCDERCRRALESELEYRGIPKPPSRAAAKREKTQARKAFMREVFKLVNERDQFKCRACGKKLSTRGGLLDRLEHHHIVLKSAGGVDNTWNLCCLCPEHHADRHAYRLLIQGDADLKLRFEQDGRVWFS